jgi:uncharacterized membrane protein
VTNTDARANVALRKRTDQLHVTTLGPREREALRLVEERPGITVAQLVDVLDVSIGRVWQMVRRLERGRVRLMSG